MLLHNKKGWKLLIHTLTRPLIFRAKNVKRKKIIAMVVNWHFWWVLNPYLSNKKCYQNLSLTCVKFSFEEVNLLLNEKMPFLWNKHYWVQYIPFCDLCKYTTLRLLFHFKLDYGKIWVCFSLQSDLFNKNLKTHFWQEKTDSPGTLNRVSVR